MLQMTLGPEDAPGLVQFAQQNYQSGYNGVVAAHFAHEAEAFFVDVESSLQFGAPVYSDLSVVGKNLGTVAW